MLSALLFYMISKLWLHSKKAELDMVHLGAKVDINGDVIG